LRRPIVTATLLALVATLTPFGSRAGSVATYLVGAGKRSINPDPDGTFAGKPVYLGGYGFGTGPIWEGLDEDRPPASGILGNGIFARAFVVSTDDDPAHALVLAEIETQGYFVAYQQGPYGLEDIRLGVEHELGIPAQRVIIGGNHTHAGPDTLGVWGGVPTEYLAYIKAQAIGAVADAWAATKPATLWFGTADAGDLVANQFSYDPANSLRDTELRILQARHGRSGKVIATLLNLSAHPTVMGGDNTLVSADWPGPAADALPGEGIVVLGALGRSQPNDGPSYEVCDGDQYCALGHYADRVLAVATQAIHAAQPLTGDAVIDGHSYLIVEPGHNALLLGLSVAGGPVGVPINRSILPPWLAGNLVGTTTFSARIGDLLFSGGPGELYPQIPDLVRHTVPAGGHFVFGLAGDMLGYIIAPFPDAYPEPIRRSFFDHNDPGDPTTWEIDPISNDNYFFNVGYTLGERVICSMLRGAGEIFGQGLAYWSAYPKCPAFAGDAALPAGADTLAPSTP
jgi:hypothetical protein